MGLGWAFCLIFRLPLQCSTSSWNWVHELSPFRIRELIGIRLTLSFAFFSYYLLHSSHIIICCLCNVLVVNQIVIFCPHISMRKRFYLSFLKIKYSLVTLSGFVKQVPYPPFNKPRIEMRVYVFDCGSFVKFRRSFR